MVNDNLPLRVIVVLVLRAVSEWASTAMKKRTLAFSDGVVPQYRRASILHQALHPNKRLLELAVISLLLSGFWLPLEVYAGQNIWTSLGVPGKEVVALVIDPTTPSTLYAAAFREGVYKS